MDFLQLVTERESIRSYNPSKPLTHDVLMQILEAGRMAPSAVNYQPWRFIVVQHPEMLEKIRASYYRTWFVDAPQILIVVGDKSKSWNRADGYNSIETDLAIVMDHLILMAESLGVGTCWVGNFNYTALREALELTENELVFAMTPLGYLKDNDRKKMLKNRKPLDELLTII